MSSARKLRNGYFLICVFSMLIVSIYFWLIEYQERKVLALIPSYSPMLNLTKMGLIVNTSTCQIPDFSPTDPEMLGFIRILKPYNCRRKSTYNSWTQIQRNELIVNPENIEKDSGFGNSLFFRSWSCCYKVITRVQQPDEKYDRQADNQVAFSDCIPILKERTKIFQEFILVECSSGWPNWIKRLPLSQHLKDIDGIHNYKNFHVIGSPDIVQDKSFRFGKQNSKKIERAPNILIIGLDSTSRLNFQRHMPKTKKVLQDLGAVEILGYTKVGDNTFPNSVSMLYGYSDEDLSRICYFNRSTKLDLCPSIWKRLDAANYLTAHAEDAPKIAIFNYYKTGFVRKPVDFYLRPFFLAAGKSDYTRGFCFGHQTTDEVLTSYLETVFETSVEHKTPIFALSWSSSNSHDDHNAIQRSDKTYANFIQRLINKGYLKNTILVFMSDHGYRYGSIRRTHIGSYEDKLPNLWISLPKNIQHGFPHWMQALQINSRRLTSPFTLYWTLNHILDTFTSTPGPSDSKDNKTRELVPRKYKQNFFEIIPESNSCEDVGIPESYCPCYPIHRVDLNDTLLIESARLSIQKVNRDILPV